MSFQTTLVEKRIYGQEVRFAIVSVDDDNQQMLGIPIPMDPHLVQTGTNVLALG